MFNDGHNPSTITFVAMLCMREVKNRVRSIFLSPGIKCLKRKGCEEWKLRELFGFEGGWSGRVE